MSPPTQLSDDDPLPTTSIISPEASNAITTPVTVCPFCFCTKVPGEECLRCEQDEEYKASLSVDELKRRDNVAVLDENSDAETTPLNQEEIRRRRVAYLSRNGSVDRNELSSSFSASVFESSCLSTIVDTLSSDNSTGNNIPNESLNGVAMTSMVEQSSQQEIHSPLLPCPTEVRVLKVQRSQICKDLINYFQDKEITTHSIVFEMIDDRGLPEKGDGVGVTRDVFSLFWKGFGDSMTIGERERVPYVRHDHFVSEWQATGRILVQGYKMVSYFPLFLSRPFLAYCLFEDAGPDLVVLELFKKYLSVDEEKLVENCLLPDRDANVLESEEVFEFLECFNCRTVLTQTNCKNVITEIAKQELIQKPHIMLSTWQPILSELKMFEPFQSPESLELLYESLKPTNKKVLQLLVAEPTTGGERDALKFLQRYVRGLETANLLHFLHFTTGADVLIVKSITVSFVKRDGIYKTPVLHTCGPVLELPSTYQDFCESREVFNNILARSDWNIDIV